MRRLRLLLALVLVWLPSLGAAQAEATLAADEVVVTADGLLVARGNVQAFYEGATLSAAAVTYDREADRLTIEGPILIRDAQGRILAAERAELDPRFENGLLRGARLVLDRQLQLAAGRIDRVDGRLTALTGAAVTSCQVCAGRAPLWEIRADRVIHDEAAGQIYFDDATFRVRGVPIFWLPALRLPDPSNARATGVLLPRIRTSNQLGFGIEMPVFVELGATRDLTVAPYLSPATRTLDLRYRQAFLAGDLLVRGAASRDDLDPGGLRGYAAVDGAFALGPGLDLAFAGRVVSDRAYLLDYGQSDADRLESFVALTRVGGRSLFQSDVTQYRSLREDEVERSLPPVTAQAAWEARRPAGGGTLTFGLSADGFVRTADEAGAAGRDLARAGAHAGWRRGWVLGPGLLAEAEGRLALDAFRVEDDPDAEGTGGRAVPAAAVTLRWPLVRRAGGASHLVEPALSLGWTGVAGQEPPNEDSTLVELDEANLHALSRLPGEDAVEDGARLSAGLSWTRAGRATISTLTLGRVVRAAASGLPEASGLAGTTSDLLVAGRLDLPGGVAVDARTLLGGALGDPAIGKTEARVDWSGAALDLSAGYLFLPEDEGEDRLETAAEWTLDAEWRPSERWTLGAGALYDVARDEPARASLAVGWRNECVEVDVSVARRYTSGGSVEPSTDFGLSINLLGFSAGDLAAAAPGACRP